MLRIGRINYANCTPIFHELQKHAFSDEYQFINGVPSRLNDLLASGEIDVCPSSSIVYALHPERYLILPEISISSIGAVGSVLLFSRIPIEELHGQMVHLSSESATSVNLLRVLLAMRFGCNCSFVMSSQPLNSAMKQSPAMLLIGDTALRASLPGHGLHMYDLGALWYEWTGLPFVFALWLYAKGGGVDRSAEVERLASRLVTAKTDASTAFDSIAEDAPESVWMGKKRLRDYWRENLSFDLGKNHLDGLRLFYRYCTELGLLQNEPVLHFLPGRQGKGR